ncbi:TPM domain-containing protein [Winogradskyella echinorum]|uniref:TPM domain-containing protein n=1 Tax=Winogradskyella echinorum TaxID=538189 RepID=A0ABR6Y3M3_9FLAO|nr:TPM domain-containing protein [Winogradskyella echinorum]MBC3847346.1 TPM domain-containing protein [Winogradskyella echinorum]MBC5751694.1 TPM domain-containing protein [Winogradskyella echinorum]
MKKSIYFTISLVFLLCLNCKDNQSEKLLDLPENKLQFVVVDNSKLFSNIENDSLTHKIIKYEELTTNEIAVLTVDSIPTNTTIQYYSTQVANSWGIGKKEKDNGLLITISKYDRKVAISTGLKTEKTISDHECKVIIDSLMIPQFKNRNYYNGVNKALDSLFILWD